MTYFSSFQTPVVELDCCILCEVCTDLAPHAFQINSAGFVEVLPLTDYSDEKIREAVSNCPRDCITWE